MSHHRAAAHRRRSMIRALGAVAFTAVLACSDEAPPGGAAGFDATASDAEATVDAADVGFDGSTDAASDAGEPAVDAGPQGDGGAVDGGVSVDNLRNPFIDTDCDGLSDAYEFSTVYPDQQKTDVADPDSDDDGILDGLEVGRTSSVAMSGCPPLSVGSNPSFTLPTNADTDGDGIADGVEDANRNGSRDGLELDPRRPDTDGDGLGDALEDRNRNGQREPNETNGAVRDTDGDGIDDGVEDRNRDGDRQPTESDPLVVDTDGDGLDDAAEDTNANGLREAYETEAYNPDTDCDGLADGAEVNRPDADPSNGEYNTSPLDPDSDDDGLSDGLEVGITSAVPGSSCPPVTTDLDPTTVTDPRNADTDGDGRTDAEEDTNRNGRVDSGETDPLSADTDGDTVSDGDEILIGTDPLDPNDPPPGRIAAIEAVCADANAKVVTFDAGPIWSLATESSMAYGPATVDSPASGVEVAGLDDSRGLAGFVLRMPLLGGAEATSAAQTTALLGRATAGAAGLSLSWAPRFSGRNVTSHDGYQTSVSNVVDVGSTSGAIATGLARNRLVALLTGLDASSITGLAADTGASSAAFVLSVQVLVRSDPEEVLLVGGVMPASDYDNTTDNRSLEINDLTNGTALAEIDADSSKVCEGLVAGGQPSADFIWMADVSGSTEDDRDNISNAAQSIFDALTNNDVDFRMGVVTNVQNRETLGVLGGTLVGDGFVRDRSAFVANLSTDDDDDGCEFGLTAAGDAIERALPKTALGAAEDPRRLREGATVAVVYISDEYAQELTPRSAQVCLGADPAGYDTPCDTGIGDLYTPEPDDLTVCEAQPTPTQQACIEQIVRPFIDQLRSPGVDGIAFAQVIPAAAAPTSCDGYACPQQPGGPEPQPSNEPGLGYTEVVNGTGGAFYTPCNPDPGPALSAIVDAVSGAASSLRLSGDPISSTIRVGVLRVGGSGAGQVEIVPRDKDDGFDYDPVANAVFFRGATYRPVEDDEVIISYRSWTPVESPCGICVDGTQCDPDLGVCVCAQDICAACGPNQVCDSACNCVCGADCNGQCDGNTVCNQETCQCECPDDCGGACRAGEVCNPSTCQCECAGDCDGVCSQVDLECNSDSCACECNDCGGRCTGDLECNLSTCDCVCAADCDEQCPNNQVCNVDNGCACECPADFACPDNTVRNLEACSCECPADCSSGCQNNEVCDPNTACNCVCDDCGGCDGNEVCDPVACLCVPAL